MGIKATVNKLNRLINHHVGLGGNQAHPSVNKFNSGFMTPDQKLTLETASEQADNAEGNMKFMADGTDVLTLPAGNYWISKALNNPVGPENGGLINYKVFIDDHLNRKEIWATVSVIGRVYYRTIHSGGSPTSGTNGWLYMNFPIWAGNTNNGDITYSNPPLKLKTGIRIHYQTISLQKGSVDILGQTGGSATFDVTNQSDDSTNTLQNYEVSVKFDLKKLTITRNVMAISDSSGVSTNDTAGVSIVGIDAI